MKIKDYKLIKIDVETLDMTVTTLWRRQWEWKKSDNVVRCVGKDTKCKK